MGKYYSNHYHPTPHFVKVNLNISGLCAFTLRFFGFIHGFPYMARHFGIFQMVYEDFWRPDGRTSPATIGSTKQAGSQKVAFLHLEEFESALNGDEY